MLLGGRRLRFLGGEHKFIGLSGSQFVQFFLQLFAVRSVFGTQRKNMHPNISCPTAR